MPRPPLRLARPLDSVRWNRDRRGHVESWFLKANDPVDPGRALWIKFTLLAPREPSTEVPVAEVWAIRFDGRGGHHRAGKSTHAVAECTLGESGVDLTFGGCVLRPDHSTGAVGEGDGRIAWDLRWDRAGQRASFGFPARWMYERAFPKSKTYTSCPTTSLRGTLSLGDETWALHGWPGMLGHNWGRTHNPRYQWAQCSMFRPTAGGDLLEDTFFEGFSARVAMGPLLTPWLTGAVVRVRGEDLAFNHLLGLFNPSARPGRFAWSLESRRGRRRLRWTVAAAPEDFVGLRYFDPGGRENQCLNSKIADCRLELWKREGRGWVPEADLTGSQSCAYEVLNLAPPHGVSMQV